MGSNLVSPSGTTQSGRHTRLSSRTARCTWRTSARTRSQTIIADQRTAVQSSLPFTRRAQRGSGQRRPRESWWVQGLVAWEGEVGGRDRRRWGGPSRRCGLVDRQAGLRRCAATIIITPQPGCVMRSWRRRARRRPGLAEIRTRRFCIEFCHFFGHQYSQLSSYSLHIPAAFVRSQRLLKGLRPVGCSWLVGPVVSVFSHPVVILYALLCMPSACPSFAVRHPSSVVRCPPLSAMTRSLCDRMRWVRGEPLRVRLGVKFTGHGRWAVIKASWSP